MTDMTDDWLVFSVEAPNELSKQEKKSLWPVWGESGMEKK